MQCWYFIPSFLFFCVSDNNTLFSKNTISFPARKKQEPFGSCCTLRYVFSNILKDSSYTDYVSVICRRCILDAGSCCTCVNNCIVSTVDSHVAAVADNISRLCVRQTYLISYASHSAGGMGQAYAEVRVYAHDKSGTIRSIRQACAAIYIWIADDLAGKAYH